MKAEVTSQVAAATEVAIAEVGGSKGSDTHGSDSYSSWAGARRPLALRLRLNRANRSNLRAAASATVAHVHLISVAMEGSAATFAHAPASAEIAYPTRLEPTSQAHLHIRGAATPHAAAL